MIGSLASVLGQGALNVGGDMLKSGMSSLGGVFNSFANGFINEFFGERAQDSALAAAQSLSAWNKALDYEYTVKRDDDLFDLTRRYLNNSAKWQVEGLKAAGLNPILAVSNLGASNGLGAGSAPSPSLGSVSPYKNKADLSESMRTLSAINLNESTAKQIQSQTALNRSTVNYQDVQSAKIAAEIESQRIANTTKVIDELSKLQHGHDSGIFGQVNKLHEQVSGDWENINQAKRKLAKQLISTVSGTPVAPPSHSAKSVIRIEPDLTPRLSYSAKSEKTLEPKKSSWLFSGSWSDAWKTIKGVKRLMQESARKRGSRWSSYEDFKKDN